FVQKGEGQGDVGDAGRQSFGVAGGLVGDGGQGNAFLFCFDHADGFAIHKEQVVGKAGLQGKFAHSDAASGVQVYLATVLHDPAAGGQLAVNVLAGAGFGCGHVFYLAILWFSKSFLHQSK
ncbi:MAG: hypothetical protein D6706_10370, partial [Chloroflexi bacterium]